jgi:hypothetical protein
MQTIPIYIAAVHRVHAAGSGDELIPFASSCPTCGHQRLQTGYTRDALTRLLRLAADIDAHCITCDSLWTITSGERVDIVKVLVCC